MFYMILLWQCGTTFTKTFITQCETLGHHIYVKLCYNPKEDTHKYICIAAESVKDLTLD